MRCLSFCEEIAAGVAKAARRRPGPFSGRGTVPGPKPSCDAIIAGPRRLELSGLILDGAGERTTIAIPCQDNSDLRVTVSKESSHALAPLAGTLREWLDGGERVAIACHQQPQAERLKELLTPYGIPCTISEAGFPDVAVPSRSALRLDLPSPS